MNFCPECAAPVIRRIPDGDTHERDVCERCTTVHYENPKIVVGCIPQREDRVLLCRRSIEPRRGYWTLPAGFLENGETIREGACRETREEALAEVTLGPLFAIVSVRHVNQVHMMFLANLAGSFGAGDETLETILATEDEVPWDMIAFPSVRFTLERFWADRRAGAFGQHLTDIERPASNVAE